MEAVHLNSNFCSTFVHVVWFTQRLGGGAGCDCKASTGVSLRLNWVWRGFARLGLRKAAVANTGRRGRVTWKRTSVTSCASHLYT